MEPISLQSISITFNYVVNSVTGVNYLHLEVTILYIRNAVHHLKQAHHR